VERLKMAETTLVRPSSGFLGRKTTREIITGREVVGLLTGL
jgi:hypothetical protein